MPITTTTSQTTTTTTTGVSGQVFYTDPNPSQPGTVDPRLPYIGEPAAVAMQLFDLIATLTQRVDNLEARITGLSSGTTTPTTSALFGSSPFGVSPFGGSSN